MAPKVQGTRNNSIHRVPPSFLTAKTLQHCKHTGLNQAYFTRPLIINTFFASLPGVNFIRRKARVCKVLHHYFTQCVCTGHTGIGHSLSIYILWTLGNMYHKFCCCIDDVQAAMCFKATICPTLCYVNQLNIWQYASMMLLSCRHSLGVVQ